MRVQVQEQDEDAAVRWTADGPVLMVRSEVLSPRAYVALVLALAPLFEQGQQELHRAC